MPDFDKNQWIQIVSALGVWAAFGLALFLEGIRKWYRRPRLRLELPRDYLVRTDFGTPPSIPVHYLHVRVRNYGRSLATDVELLVERIEKSIAQGPIIVPGNDNPTNLPLAATNKRFSRPLPHSLSAKFDIGHITEPDRRATITPPQAGWNTQPSATCLVMEYEFVPNALTHILDAGRYLIHLVAVAGNAEPARAVLEVRIAGTWDPDAKQMQIERCHCRI